MLLNRSNLSANLFLSVLILYANVTVAAEAQTISPSSSMMKMVVGLGLVLVVMFGITWFAKRLLPHSKASNSTVKVVGGVSVGARERVVVVEVAGRWLVVGVASGHVSAIADLAPEEFVESGLENTPLPTNLMEHKAANFKQWLSQAMKK